MHVIQTKPIEPGVYNDHKAKHITTPPEGWAMIPEGMELPSTFPRLGSLEAEEIAYPYEVEVKNKVIKTRDVELFDENGEPVLDENGQPVIVQEEYTETEIVKEQRERIIMTVTKMTEGTLPDPEPEPETVEDVSWDDMAAAITEGVNEV